MSKLLEESFPSEAETAAGAPVMVRENDDPSVRQWREGKPSQKEMGCRSDTESGRRARGRKVPTTAFSSPVTL